MEESLNFPSAQTMVFQGQKGKRGTDSSDRGMQEFKLTNMEGGNLFMLIQGSEGELQGLEVTEHEECRSRNK